jgi:uncharacterized membrane protein YbhN (UPF0104 family)
VRRWVGVAVGTASAAYFLGQVRARWPEIAALPWNGAVALGLAGAFSVQFASALLDAWTWAWALRAMGVAARSRDAVAIFGISQFAKYLPGNVAQHLGRVAGATDKGWQMGRVILTMLLENGVAAGSAALFAAAGALLFSDGAGVGGVRRTLAVALVLAGSAVGVVAMRLLLAHPPAFARRFLALDGGIHLGAGFLAGYLATHVVSYLALGTGLVLIIHALAGGWPPGLWRAPAAVALSWLAGFLVPGAPAGLGVREATLAALLGPSLGTEIVVAAALLWRLASLVADAAMLGVGLALRARTATV